MVSIQQQVDQRTRGHAGTRAFVTRAVVMQYYACIDRPQQALVRNIKHVMAFHFCKLHPSNVQCYRLCICARDNLTGHSQGQLSSCTLLIVEYILAILLLVLWCGIASALAASCRDADHDTSVRRPVASHDRCFACGRHLAKSQTICKKRVRCSATARPSTATRRPIQLRDCPFESLHAFTPISSICKPLSANMRCLTRGGLHTFDTSAVERSPFLKECQIAAAPSDKPPALPTPLAHVRLWNAEAIPKNLTSRQLPGVVQVLLSLVER
jgi:hypothetical protein